MENLSQGRKPEFDVKLCIFATVPWQQRKNVIYM